MIILKNAAFCMSQAAAHGEAQPAMKEAYMIAFHASNATSIRFCRSTDRYVIFIVAEN